MFTPGARVSFECNEGFVLIGDSRRVCRENGQWDIPEYGYTECLRKYRCELLYKACPDPARLLT